MGYLYQKGLRLGQRPLIVYTLVLQNLPEFFVHIFSYKDKEKGISSPRKRSCEESDINKNAQTSEESTSKAQDESIKPRRSKREKITKDFGSDFMTFVLTENLKPIRMLWNHRNHLIGKILTSNL
ncbi:hypothetical protein OSB04_005987 [Centaurea solstitialis]|uniref:Uncharacterized protein n=1 Tax=Centaurea solstitialis TaxID=347529 RepID=A0AA38WH03_9ASTR|nr:hypothetical protein OSB04_005987 [Centaurea solstitialis]